MLEVDHLDVSYGPVRVVKDISLKVEQGEMVAVLGANGAGKSSTLLAIAGAVKAASGTIKLQGEDVTTLPPERMVRLGLAMVPGNPQRFSRFDRGGEPHTGRVHPAQQQGGGSRGPRKNAGDLSGPV